MSNNYVFIKNPITNKKYNIMSRQGKNIINNYLYYLIGGTSKDIVTSDTVKHLPKVEHLKNKTFDEMLELWNNPSTNKNVVDFFNSLNEDEEQIILKKNGHFLKFMGEEQKDEEILVEIAIENSFGTAIQWASYRLKADDSIVTESLKWDAYNVKWADRNKYLDNTEFMQNLMEQNYQSLQFATPRVKIELNWDPNLEHEEYIDQQGIEEGIHSEEEEEYK